MSLDASLVICDTLVILEGGLRPPSFLISLSVGALSFLQILILSSADTLVILESGLRPPSFLMGLLVGVLSLDASLVIC